ncbi:ArsA family ATPase [Thermostichus vulcanus]|uniref:ArsA family ATPase n=1 Tax=Thermostichus vulcanus str. 'Rupite' TaxID=2813851 RepID=A0ABT0CAQ6_THEVL|nr:ArsA family ATPase [Thermostichus vulcanus]MCJ2542866.1 ArsA family ATPase [Thermostichus vulcanus str. 'Rupite']
MSQILTFLGKGGTGRSTLAVAAARAAAQQGRRVLLVGHQAGPGLEMLLGGIPLSGDPVTIAANLSVVQLRTTQLLEQNWTAAKELEAQYVRTPFFREIYGQELGVLPGMDQALALEALRRYDASGQYDCILYDGPGDLTTLRAFGIPEVASWYWRRASKAFLGSDLAKTLRPFAEPLLRSVSNVEFASLEDLPDRMGGMTNILEQGRQAIADPRRVLVHLVTTLDPIAIQTARYLWGSAQMVGLTVGGLWVTPIGSAEVPAAEFAPLTVRALPTRQGSDWSGLEAAVGGMFTVPDVPPPLAIDEGSRTVKLFIPGFTKAQIELSQSGPELTITAGDQRRNLFLPPSLAGRQVTGAKFQEPFLLISFG